MNKSHLLINETALQVLPSLAKSIGLEEAIILQQLHYWLNNSKVEGRIEEGEKWIYNSYQEWQDNFPFWSVQQIQRIFLNLEKGGVVISAKLDAKKHDQTKFYRIDYDALCAMEHIKFDSSKVSESNDVNKELHRLPENTNLSISEPTVSTLRGKNAQLELTRETRKSTLQTIKGIEAALFSDRPVTNDDLPMMELALKEFESALSLPANWNWYPAKSGDEKAWRELRDFIFEKWQADNGTFRKYATWRATPYVKGALSNLAIQRKPYEFITSWSDYLASESMINSKTAPEYKPLPEDNNVYVPNPNRRTS